MLVYCWASVEGVAEQQNYNIGSTSSVRWDDAYFDYTKYGTITLSKIQALFLMVSIMPQSSLIMCLAFLSWFFHVDLTPTNVLLATAQYLDCLPWFLHVDLTSIKVLLATAQYLACHPWFPHADLHVTPTH